MAVPLLHRSSFHGDVREQPPRTASSSCASDANENAEEEIKLPWRFDDIQERVTERITQAGNQHDAAWAQSIV